MAMGSGVQHAIYIVSRNDIRLRPYLHHCTVRDCKSHLEQRPRSQLSGTSASRRILREIPPLLAPCVHAYFGSCVNRACEISTGGSACGQDYVPWSEPPSHPVTYPRPGPLTKYFRNDRISIIDKLSCVATESPTCQSRVLEEWWMAFAWRP